MAAYDVEIKSAELPVINNNEELQKAIDFDGQLFINNGGEVFMALYVWSQDTKSGDGEWWFLQLRSVILNHKLPNICFPLRKLPSGAIVELKIVR